MFFVKEESSALEQAKRILVKGKAHGLKPKIHADEMSMLGGAEIAADVGASLRRALAVFLC